MLPRATTTLLRTIKSSLSPKLWPLIVGCVLLSGLVIALLVYGGTVWMQTILPGFLQYDWVINLLSGTAGMMIAWAVFPLLMPTLISAFVNKIAAIVEKREYPTRPPGKDMPFLPELAMDLKFTLKALLLNLLILPLYLLLPGLNLVLYYVINSYLLGTQYFVMVARRHHEPTALRVIARTRGNRVLLYGLFIVAAGTLPALNLIAPLFATVLMVHVYQSINIEEQAQIAPVPASVADKAI